MNLPIVIPELAYHINNVCNLTCNNCISYSNLRPFTGHSKFIDSYDKNLLWPQYINPHKIQITGGETFLNPDLLNWVQGVRKIWPNHYMSVLTNGTLLHKKKNKQIAKEIINLGIELEISIHSPNHFASAYKEFTDILSDSKIEYIIEHKIDSKNNEKILEDVTKFRNVKNNKVLGTIERKLIFFNNSILHNSNVITMHDNDINLAHDICCLKNCAIIVDGKLYKCPVVSIGKNLIKQFNVDYKHKKLIEEYDACDPSSNTKIINEFLTNITKPIKQCSLCPTNIDKKFIPLYA